MSTLAHLVAERAPNYGQRVRILDASVVHRIAAGEVIERPASAVKELIENSLDAGADRINIGIEGGGARLIRVRDNGCGMTAGDAGRAVLRHATSKISSAEDLSDIESLGFRGEALHAMGSVSMLSLVTRAPGSRLGSRVEVFAGQITRTAPTAHPVGTTVEVRDLFFNLPVRKGFLGTERAETNAVRSVVEMLALSRPDAGFFFKADGVNVLALPAVTGLRERIAQVHGLQLARALISLEEDIVRGYVSPLPVSFPTRRYQHVTVNGRVVEPDSFAPAIAKAYADLLPKGRHAAAFLRLELGYGEVDVNVHPAKSTVRLRGGRSAYPLVVGAIRAALSLWKGKGAEKQAPDEDQELTLIGQFAGRCILAYRGEELLILDQHGVHERILYEKLLRHPAQSPRHLPEAAVVRIPEGMDGEVWSREEELQRLGFSLEPFGTGALRILSVPESVTDPSGALWGAVEALLGGEDLAKALACRGSAKFGATLSSTQMEVLLREWETCEFPDICPHGRPIVKRLALPDILREFGRG